MSKEIRKPFTEKNGLYINTKGEWGFVYTDSNGKRRREMAGTYEHAVKQRKTRLSEIANNKRKISGSYDTRTFKEALPIFIENHVNNLGSKKSTTSMINKIAAEFNYMKLCNISTLSINSFYNRMGREYSYSYANRIMGVYSKFFNSMIDWDLFSGNNPCLKVKKKKPENYEPNPLSEEETRQFIATVADYIRPCVYIGFYTGLRCKELLNLRWEYINMESNTIRITETKTGLPRTLGISKDIKEVLNKIGPKKEGNVFFITHSQLRSQFDITCKKLGLRHTRPHDMRHTFAVTFLNKGGRIEILQRLLGHRSLKTTQKYLRFKKDEIAVNMLVMDGFVSPEVINISNNDINHTAINPANNPNYATVGTSSGV